MVIQLRAFRNDIGIDVTVLLAFVVPFNVADLLGGQIVVAGNDPVNAVVSCNRDASFLFGFFLALAAVAGTVDTFCKVS